VPFGPRHCLAQATWPSSKLLKRSQFEPPLLTANKFGRIEIRPAQRQVLVDDQVVAIAARAYDVLMALIEHRDRIITKNELLDLVWPGLVVEEHNLHTHVSSLRKAIGARAIATIPGRGYRFVAAPSVVEAAEQPSTAEPPSLIGREADLATLGQLLDGCRVLTIWGPGGVGKTTVARRLFEHVVAGGRREAVWVELSSVSDPARIPNAVAMALTLRDTTDTTLAGLCRVFAQRQTLIVLDNCEHLAADVADAVQQLLIASRGIQFIVTSREPLKLRDEQRHILEGLALPAAGASLNEARAAAALQLLERRARLADSRFALEPRNVSSAIELCRALEGNPLAIEMAASRIHLFGLAGVASRLGDRFRFLSSSTRNTAQRHSSLRATLAWSYSLLSESAQRALRRLSVFAGIFSIEAAQRLLLMEHGAQADTLDAIAELVDKSLLAEVRGMLSRRRLVETTRLFAAELLNQEGEQDVTFRHHEAVMTALGEQSDEAFWSLGDHAWLARYGDDLPDLLAAFDRACARADADAAAALGIALRAHGFLKGLDAMLRQVTERLLDLLPQAGPIAQARVWTFVSSVNVLAVRGVSKRESSRRCLGLWQALGHEAFSYESLCRLAGELAGEGEFEQAETELKNAARLMKADWPARRRMMLLRAQASLAKYREDHADFDAKQRATLRLATEAGDITNIARCHVHLACAALLAGRLDEALDHARQARTRKQRTAAPHRCRTRCWSAQSKCCMAISLPLRTRASWLCAEPWRWG
jgi:predicted ATPase/DNA-binding winged helix-turn-helix (wHTH) protein